MEKYIKLKHFQELLKIINKRDSVYDWTDEHERLNQKVKNTVVWLERNARTLEELKEINKEN